jgi:peroxiredoxin
MHRLRTCLACLALLGAVARAEDPDPRDILKRSAAAIRAQDSVSYKAIASGRGILRNVLPEVRGELKMRRGAAVGKPLLRVTGSYVIPDSKMLWGFPPHDAYCPEQFDAVSDGEQALVSDIEKRVYRKDAAAVANFEHGPINQIWFPEWALDQPFADELAAKVIELRGTSEIGGVKCHIIHVDFGKDDQQVRWHIGIDDLLPRRAERIMRWGNGIGTRLTEITSITLKPELNDATFLLTPPAGFRELSGAGQKWIEKPGPGPLAVGSSAPGWGLRSTDGAVISLEQLAGRVVVLHFCAPWCAPCKETLAAVQAVHEKFAGRPVSVFGVSVWPKGGDPAAFHRQHKAAYPLLLEADDVAAAYGVNAIPTVIVIGPDSRVGHVQIGTDEASNLIAAVERLIPKP